MRKEEKDGGEGGRVRSNFLGRRLKDVSTLECELVSGTKDLPPIRVIGSNLGLRRPQDTI